MPQLLPHAEDRARLREILQELADEDGHSYLLIPHGESGDYTGVLPYGVRTDEATARERQESVERIDPQPRGEA